ncbi:hypothetical protein HN858_00560 [Candidatus Falkowbacteria bacterium]|jgi:hypothetical protein|nr:hypothetical protein [Candidatus Falkowbacteria bacterium]MBT5503242.1 hypothetical protein [Candidatus Falkowbacteria bacterium]MBT6574241.1 hypothetical protein [Candidatus Falkowbacteria bacterium]MBT7348145.1 hypothetical protein [Candidatus Falkowbacteria bacterium]MBT7500794.1 hypothetical protein [Candidatus Falkowbacteria bacterium]
MKSIEQLTENSLKANFTEVQQAHFDKLMSELEEISGGLGFAELKEKAEAGDKEALQVMRDYIAKKEEIVEFIETKKIKIKIGDIVYMFPSYGRKTFEKGTVESIDGNNVEFLSETIGKHTTPIGFVLKESSRSVKTLQFGEAKLLASRDLYEHSIGDNFIEKSDRARPVKIVGFTIQSGIAHVLWVFDFEIKVNNDIFNEDVQSFNNRFKKVE